MTSIADTRPPGATSNTQSFGGRGNALGDVKSVREMGGRMADNVDNTFYRFERAGSDLSGITDRVYVNAAADTSSERSSTSWSGDRSRYPASAISRT